MLRALPLLLLVASCSEPTAERPAPVNEVSETPAAMPRPGNATQTESPKGEPAAEPAAEGRSAEDAAEVLRAYYALIEEGKFAEAWKLREPGAGAGPADAEAFARSFDPYAEYRATVGTPGPISGAAGSLYVDVPVQIYGRMKDGRPFSSTGTITLRRVNDVPGSTEEQRRWRIQGRD